MTSSMSLNLSVTPRNRANLRRLKTNSLQSIKRWEKENELLYAMIEDLSDWLLRLFSGVVITPEFFFFALEDGSLLCRLANYIQEKAEAYAQERDITVPGKRFRYNTPLKKGTKEQKLFRSRENVQLFLTWCRNHGIPEAILFESNDVVQVDECREGGREIVICLMELARRSYKKFELDKVPQLIQMEKEIEREESEVVADKNDQGERLDVLTVNTRSAQQTEPDTTSPMSADSDSGVESVFEEENPASRLSEFSSDDKNTKSAKKPELPSLLESTAPKTELDKQVCKIAQDYNIKVIHRLKEGKYIILGRIMFVRMLNDHLLLRIGGGWDTLEHYIMTHVPKPGVGTGPVLTQGASPRTSWNVKNARARLFEHAKTKNYSPNADSTDSPVVISKASSPGNPVLSSKLRDKVRKRFSVTDKDEKDISAAIRKISSSVLTPKTPQIASKTFFLLKNRFEKGIFGKGRRRDSEPILGETELVKQRVMADCTENDAVDGLASPAPEINANEIDLKENREVSSPEFFVQNKVTSISDTCINGDGIHTKTAIEEADVTDLDDSNTPGSEDGASKESNLDDINEEKAGQAEELISFDEPTGGQSFISVVKENNEVEASPQAELKNENETASNILEGMKPESGDSKLEAEPVREDEKETEEIVEAKPEVTLDASISEVKEEQQPEVVEVAKVKEVAMKTEKARPTKPKPKAAVIGRPKSPTKLPTKSATKTDPKKEVGKPGAVAKKEASTKPSAPKPGAVAKKEASTKPSAAKAPKAEAKKPADKPKTASAKKEPTAGPKAPAASQKRPASAASKPAVAGKVPATKEGAPPKKAAPAKTTRPPSATAPKKTTSAKPATEPAKPVASRTRPQSAKPAGASADKTDGRAVAKRAARPQSATAKPKATVAPTMTTAKKTTTTAGPAKDKQKPTTTGNGTKAAEGKTAGKETKTQSKAPRPASGVRKVAEGKPTAKPRSAKPGAAKPDSTTKSSVPQKPNAAGAKTKVGTARPKSPVKGASQKEKGVKLAGPAARKKSAEKKEKDKIASGGKVEEAASQPVEDKPSPTEVEPNLESPATTEGVVHETKSETVEVEGDVVVKTMVTTQEVIGPDGETQITTTTERVAQEKVEEISSPEPSDPAELSNEDQPTPTEVVPNLESPPTTEGDVHETKSETVEVEGDVVVKTMETTEEVIGPDGETQITTITEKETEEMVEETSSPEPSDPAEFSNEDQPTPTEVVPNLESPPTTEGVVHESKSEAVDFEGETMVTTEEVIGPDGETQITTITEKETEEQMEEISSPEPSDPAEFSNEDQPTPTEVVPNLESPPTTEGDVHETKSETVEVEGDVVVKTMETTEEVIGPDGETQTTTITEKETEEQVEETSSPEPSDQPSATEAVPNLESPPTTEESETVEVEGDPEIVEPYGEKVVEPGDIEVNWENGAEESSQEETVADEAVADEATE